MIALLGLIGSAVAAGASAATPNAQAVTGGSAKARAVAQDFESVYLNTIFNQMFTNIDGDGPFGGGPAIGVWRSFLTEEYAASFARNGGIGLADHVYRELLAQQQVSAKTG
jgi:Rod binding domain-containing protein